VKTYIFSFCVSSMFSQVLAPKFYQNHQYSLTDPHTGSGYSDAHTAPAREHPCVKFLLGFVPVMTLVMAS